MWHAWHEGWKHVISERTGTTKLDVVFANSGITLERREEYYLWLSGEEFEWTFHMDIDDTVYGRWKDYTKGVLNGMKKYLDEDSFDVDQLQLDVEEYREAYLRMAETERTG
jgi:hypothetical protein